ncbi:hypothetical protein Q6348_01845 [Isoptericola sp. b441]|uniref:Septum formation-related domain-containing protein n=1 Tax=Actinotalea lenta TaxID=3064654 RepID=A0ABT9D592_9CELL|nr:hypothetical protein [Isoptericola sp. b441]MDO8105935.1 hypothetical protein [Isoptericola sp. b441]
MTEGPREDREDAPDQARPDADPDRPAGAGPGEPAGSAVPERPWASPGWTPPGARPPRPGPYQAPQYPPPQYQGPQYQGPQGSVTPPPGYPQPYYGPGWRGPVTPPPRRRNTAGTVLVVLAGVAAAVLVVGGVIGTRYWLETRPLGTVDHAMTVHAGRLGTGHCLAELPQDGTVSSVRVVPCSEPHVAEVVGSRPIGGSAWPGRGQVTDELVAWCEMDTAEAKLGLRPVIWEPTRQGWAQGDRSGLCLAWSPDGAITGSFVAGDQVAKD